jgi:small subunit ribosomal protein S2
LAIKEANRLKIPVVAILDTNCDPNGVTYPIPANDDAGRAIALYCDLIARAAIDGIGRSQGAMGMDVGAAEAPPEEPALATAAVIEAEAPAEAFELLAAPRGAPDDLARLQGVGPQIVKKLNDGGVFHYWQIAALSAEQAEKLDHDLKLGGRIVRDNWIEQARGFTAG